MPLDPLHAETMVAALGLDRILAGTPSFTRTVQEESITFPKRARALLLRALSGGEGDAVDEPAFKYDDAKKLLEADTDQIEQRHQKLFAELPDDIQDDVQAAATRAIQYLQANFPRQLTKTTARLGVSPPEPFALDRFARQWRIVIDPMSALRAMVDGSLDMVQVAALEEAYPAIYKLIADPAGGGLLDDALATVKGRRGERWDVTDDQDRQIKILLGQPPIDMDLANDFASVQPITPPPAPRAKAQKNPARPVDELLPGQKQA